MEVESCCSIEASGSGLTKGFRTSSLDVQDRVGNARAAAVVVVEETTTVCRRSRIEGWVLRERKTEGGYVSGGRGWVGKWKEVALLKAQGTEGARAG